MGPTRLPHTTAVMCTDRCGLDLLNRQLVDRAEKQLAGRRETARQLVDVLRNSSPTKMLRLTVLRNSSPTAEKQLAKGLTVLRNSSPTAQKQLANKLMTRSDPRGPPSRGGCRWMADQAEKQLATSFTGSDPRGSTFQKGKAAAGWLTMKVVSPPIDLTQCKAVEKRQNRGVK